MDARLHPRRQPKQSDGRGGDDLNVDQYAIHGTNDPGSIGGFVSFGCIRMHNRDILDLYNRVHVGTRVVVLRCSKRLFREVAPTLISSRRAPNASRRTRCSGRSKASGSIDATHVLAGPFATDQLAVLGADVIKVEHPREPDQSRGTGTDKGLNRINMGTSRPSLQQALHHVGPEDESDREILKRLVVTADALWRITGRVPQRSGSRMSSARSTCG
jgi:hypothetical protein